MLTWSPLRQCFDASLRRGTPNVKTARELRAVRIFVFGIVFTIICLAAVGYIVLRTGMIPANADAQPSTIEAFIARTSLRATLDRDAPKGPNPVAMNDSNLIEGIRLYARNCVICHGDATGDRSASAISKGEYPAPPQLATDGVEDDPEGWTFWKVKHGIRWTGMPSWQDALTDEQIWMVALFLGHMDKLPPSAEAAWKQVHAEMQAK